MRSFEGKNEEVEILKIEYHHLHKKPRFVHPINPQLKDHTIIINAATCCCKEPPFPPKTPPFQMGESVMIAHILHLSFGEGVFLLSPSTWKLPRGNIFYLHHSAKQETINPAAPPTGVVDITQAQ